MTLLVIVASLVFSFLLPPEAAKETGQVMKSFSSFWFNLAFIRIGLEPCFAELKALESKKIFVRILIGQEFYIIFTLIIAYFLFHILT